MALTRPVNLFGRVRLHVYGSDTTTSLGTIRGQGVSGTHSKVFTDSGLSLTASVAEAVLAADETVLERAFIVPEVEYAAGWLPFGTPYLLAPGTSKVRGGDSRRTHSPVAVGALSGLLEECIIFPTAVDEDHPTFRRGGGLERNRYFNYGSIGYSESLHTWHDADIYDPAGQKKEDKPDDWPAALAAAEWVWRDADEGGRTCCRFGTFTLAADQRVVFVVSSDENSKIQLDGPNQGGIVLDWDADEDGYNQGFDHKTLRLEAGTYRVSAQFLSINSTGGDGNDSIRFGCYSIATDGSGDVDEVLLMSGTGTRVLRQAITDQLPGMSPGETMRRALQVVSDVGSEAADLLLANRTFTDTLDTDGAAWTTFVEWVWPWGTSLASVFQDMLAEIDIDMGPTFTFDAWEDRGADLSATVDMVPGASPSTADMNIVSSGSDSDPAGPNAYLTESQEGSGLYQGTVPAGERRRFGSLESGASGTVARANRNARQAVKANGEARRYYDITIIAVTDSVPYVDFNLCDVYHGRGYRDLGLDLEATAFGWSQSDALKVTITGAEPVS